MKLHQEDPRLTAYVLGELSPEEAAAVESAAADDKTVRAAIVETGAMRDRLHEVFGTGEDKLSAKNRENILKAAKESARQGKIERLKSHNQARKVWLVPLAAAAVIGGGIFLLTMVPAPKGKKPGAVGSKVDSAAPENSEGVKISREGDLSKLPLEAGKRSLSQITAAVRVERRMPKKGEVRIEELLNAFPLKAKGAASLWKGCSLGAEIISCPWKPSGNLVIISVQGARDSEKELSLEFRPDESELSSHRLLGYSNGKPSIEASTATTIGAGESILLVMETVGNGSSVGDLVWTVDGTDAPPLHLVHDDEKEPSEDAGFAALVSGFGLWLRGEESPAVDEAVILGLAREVAAGSIVADRYDFLYLVDQAVKISTEGETD